MTATKWRGEATQDGESIFLGPPWLHRDPNPSDSCDQCGKHFMPPDPPETTQPPSSRQSGAHECEGDDECENVQVVGCD